MTHFINDDLTETTNTDIESDDNSEMEMSSNTSTPILSNINISQIDPIAIYNLNLPKPKDEQNINEQNATWIELYRPLSFDNLLAQSHISIILQYFLKSGYLPNMLFFGAPGVGKTSLANICAKYLYTINYDFMVLSINASEERGIDIVRNKIKTFAISYSDTLRFIILDEADSMTLDAQFMLCEIIDTYITSVRFCIICNNIYKIIPQLRSRCFFFNFEKLSSKDISSKIKFICKKHNISLTNNSYHILLNTIYNGDMRKIINAIQSINFIHKKITIDNILTVASYPSENTITKILSILLDTNNSMEIKCSLIKKLSYNINFIHIINSVFLIIDFNNIKTINQFISNLNKLIISINSNYQQVLDIHIYSFISLFVLAM
jgi:DNA polymerase III delta prime subunit